MLERQLVSKVIHSEKKKNTQMTIKLYSVTFTRMVSKQLK